MTEEEAFKILTLASLRDNRTVTRAHAQAWAADLWKVNYQDAEKAVSQHYATSSAWLMPSHVRDGARIVAADRERIERQHRRAIEEKSREDAWADQKRFMDEHDGMTPLQWYTKQISEGKEI